MLKVSIQKINSGMRLDAGYTYKMRAIMLKDLVIRASLV
jgi:hypothetical protein